MRLKKKTKEEERKRIKSSSHNGGRWWWTLASGRDVHGVEDGFPIPVPAPHFIRHPYEIPHRIKIGSPREIQKDHVPIGIFSLFDFLKSFVHYLINFKFILNQIKFLKFSILNGIISNTFFIQRKYYKISYKTIIFYMRRYN